MEENKGFIEGLTLIVLAVVVVAVVFTHPWLLWYAGALAGLYLLARFGLWAFFPQRELSANRSRYLRVRLKMHLHPGKGQATSAALFVRFGRLGMLKQSKRIRPELGLVDRIKNPDAYSTFAGRAHLALKARISAQVCILLLSVPRAGKTAWLARTILHHPGSVISTSSQPDVFRLTSGMRQQLGRVHLFNPAGLGGIESTFRWDLVAGCDDEATCVRRADAIVNATPKSGAEGSDWFASKASDNLRALLLAGATAGVDFRAVSEWIMTGQMAEPIDALNRAGYYRFAATLGELNSRAGRTADTILMFLSRAIQFAADPSLLASVLPAEGDGLDLESLVRNRETLYLVAPVNGDDSPLAGLFAALVTEIHHVARQVAACMPGGRLSPAVLYALDELCQAAPIPAASWAADSGGRGIQMIMAAHGQAQLEDRYGKAGARQIMDCAAAKLVWGGISDPDTLQDLERLCGQVALREHGHDSHARHPIMSVDMIRELPDWHALLVSGNNSPVIVRPPVVWADPAYKRLKADGRDVAELTPARPPRALPRPADAEPEVLAELATISAEWSESDD